MSQDKTPPAKDAGERRNMTRAPVKGSKLPTMHMEAKCAVHTKTVSPSDDHSSHGLGTIWTSERGADLRKVPTTSSPFTG